MNKKMKCRLLKKTFLRLNYKKGNSCFQLNRRIHKHERYHHKHNNNILINHSLLLYYPKAKCLICPKETNITMFQLIILPAFAENPL